MQFRFKDKERPMGFASSMSGALHNYPVKDVLSGPYLLEEWKPDLVESLLDLLTPDNVRIGIVAQEFEDICKNEEKYYGTKHNISKIPDDLLQSWKNPESICDRLHLPPPNEFIATKFDLVERDPDNGQFPTILKDFKLGRVWYRQDDEFKRPKCNMFFNLDSPMAYIDPHHANLSRMFVSLFKDDIAEYSYDAELASLYYTITNSRNGLTLSISGTFINLIFQFVCDVCLYPFFLFQATTKNNTFSSRR